MSDQPVEIKIDRVLVALDASPNSMAALEAAVDLASKHNASLVGLFVEDLNLIRLAQLPFAFEVVRNTARLRQLGLKDLERQLRVRARRVRRALARLANRSGVDWDFRVTRGEVPLEVLAEAEKADWIILGKSGWSRGRKLGSTTRRVLNQAKRSTLVLERGLQLERPIVSLFDGSQAARRSLAAAAMLARSQQVGISVFLLGEGEAELRRLQEEAAGILAQHNVKATYRWMEGAASESLVQAIQQVGCLLVLAGDLPEWRGDSMIELVNQLKCPVLVVR